MAKCDQLDISHELMISRYRNGIQLVKPELAPTSHLNSRVETILQLPCNVYFLDTDSIHRNMNESNAQTLWSSTIQSVIGKSVFAITKRDYAKRVRANDLSVMRRARTHFIEEDFFRKDEAVLNCLSIKYPRYNNEGKIVGLFGFSIIMGLQSVAEALSKITSLGFLVPPQFDLNSHSVYIDKDMNQVYFSKRELEIVRILVRGKTAKEVALNLQLSKRTVEHYIENIKDKMGATNKSELIEMLFNSLDVA